MPFSRACRISSPVWGVAFLLAAAPVAFGKSVEVDWVDQLFKGGLTIWVQLALSVVGLGVVLERLVNLRQRWIVPRGLLARLLDSWRAGNYDDVVTQGHASRSILGSVAAFAATHRDMTYSELNSACGDIASAGIRRHQQAAYLLAVVATLEPLLGLLGTVIGMIEAFQIVGQAGGMGDASLLADSIAKALVTTAVGLILAIPALGLYHLFRLRAGSLGLLLEKEINEFLVATRTK